MNAQDRADLAAAASTVDGVTVSPYFRQITQAGEGFVKLLARTRPAKGIGWVDTWQVWISLGQDVRAAEVWIENHAAAVAAALRPEMTVTTITPAEMLLDQGSVNGVIFEGSRASAS